MTFFETITKVGHTMAAACVLALPLWLLGVPGVENQYARGWKMGLNVLLLFPPAWLCVNATHRRNGKRVTGTLAAFTLAVAAVRLLQAIRTMMDDEEAGPGFAAEESASAGGTTP